MFILDNLNSGGGQLALATLTNAAQIRRIDQDVVHCCRIQPVAGGQMSVAQSANSNASSRQGTPELAIGPAASDRTRWVNPPYALRALGRT